MDAPYRATLRVAGIFAVTACLVLLAYLCPLPHEWAGLAEELDAAAAAQLESFAGRVAPAELEGWLRLVDPLAQLTPILRVTGAKAHAVEADVEVRLAAQPLLRPPPALQGRVIVLDPGHQGGAWSELEKRHVVRGDGPAVREGDLTYATALLLRERLARHGARVLLTRGAPPSQPFPDGVPREYDAEHESRLWLAEAGLSRLPSFVPPWPTLSTFYFGAALRQREMSERAFELFNRWELRRRIGLAAREQADLYLSLHYNMVDGLGKNGVLVFVPGNFLEGELQTRSQRLLATRLLLSGALREALPLARAIGLELQRRMRLPPIAEPRPTPDGSLPNRITVDAEAGVYARNLGVLRRAAIPALLVEGPCMNEPEEYRRLAKLAGSIDGVPYPARALEYADAVTAALLGTPGR